MSPPAAGTKLWSNVMEILDEKDGVDTELLVYAMTLINKVCGLAGSTEIWEGEKSVCVRCQHSGSSSVSTNCKSDL